MKHKTINIEFCKHVSMMKKVAEIPSQVDTDGVPTPFVPFLLSSFLFLSFQRWLGPVVSTPSVSSRERAHTWMGRCAVVVSNQGSTTHSFEKPLPPNHSILLDADSSATLDAFNFAMAASFANGRPAFGM